MKRRTFLSSGLVFVTPLRRRILGISTAEQSSSVSQRLQAGMIWSATTSEVPLAGPPRPIANGAAHGPVVDTDEHVVFLCEVVYASKPAEAALHLFAFTRYRLYVNGQYAGRGPSRFQNQRPEYDTRDVTELMKAGVNSLAILVHRDAPSGRIMSHAPGFAAVLEAVDLEGSTQFTATDVSWKAVPELSFGPRRQAWASIEENIDARVGQRWLTPELDRAHWQSAVSASGSSLFPLWPRGTPMQSETPQPLTADGAALPLRLVAPATIDLNTTRIMQAYHLLHFDAAQGTQVDVSYRLPQKPDSGSCTYISTEGKQTWMGGDSFCFNRITIRIGSGSLVLTGVEAVEVKYPFERVGRFSSSDPLLNQLWEICARSLEILSEDAYVDCSDRERVEWMDCSPPAFECTRVLMAGPHASGAKVWSDPRLMQALLRRTALTQQPDGQLKAHTCSNRWDTHAIMEDRSCDWVIGARQYYDSTGDAKLIREIWPVMAHLMDWFLSKRTTRGLIQAREWELWDNPLRYQICEGAGLNAMVYHALRDAAFLGGVNKSSKESAAYSAAATKLASDFNRLLWDEVAGSYSGALFGPNSRINTDRSPPLGNNLLDGVYGPTVQSALLCLDSGIVPLHRVERVQRFVLQNQADVTGVMSHYFLFKALYEMNQPDLDEQVLTRMRVGWKAQVESEWQTTWEGLTGGSKVHIYGIHPAFWLSAFALGVRRQGPTADRRLLIEPRCGQLTHCEGVVVTEFGPVPMKWARTEKGILQADFVVPEGVQATVRMAKRGSSASILVDGKRRSAALVANSLVVDLTSGRHIVAELI